jgi:hypothetical protein
LVKDLFCELVAFDAAVGHTVARDDVIDGQAQLLLILVARLAEPLRTDERQKLLVDKLHVLGGKMPDVRPRCRLYAQGRGGKLDGNVDNRARVVYSCAVIWYKHHPLPLSSKK